MSNGEEDLSIETYEKALVENPKQPSCLKNIGLIYEKGEDMQSKMVI